MRRSALTLLCAVLSAAAVLHSGVSTATIVLPRIISSGNFAHCPGGPAWLESRRQARHADHRRIAPSDPALHDALIALEPRTENGAEAAANAAAEAAATAADAAANAASPDVAIPNADQAVGNRTPPEQAESVQFKRLQALMARSGIPSVSQVGSDGMLAFLDALQDAPSESRLRLGTELLGVRGSDLDPWLKRRLAEMIDNILDDRGLPQRYGTLFDIDAQRRIVLKQPVEDIATLPARRAAADLIPIALELCVRRDADDGGTFWPPLF